MESVIVAQLGARMHYAVPRILHRAGLLERLYTDLHVRKEWLRWLRPARLQRLANRMPEEIPPERITAFTALGLRHFARFWRTRNMDDRIAAALRSGREFGRRVADWGFGSADAVYAFNSAALEILHEAKRRGVKGIVEQTIAPRAVERIVLREEAARFPDWAGPYRETRVEDEFCERESAEWAAADLIVCGSEFVRKTLVDNGACVERCEVVPYGFDRMASMQTKPPRQPGPLRVLTVGAIGLRKGSPYVLAAARQFEKSAFFRMVGAIEILPKAELALRQHVELTGPVAGGEIAAHYAWADVFLLPSLCEGSATVTYEAMAHGLPVICTPETGSTVRDGINGFIVPARAVEAMVKRLAILASNPELLEKMSANAFRTSTEHTLEKYGERLIHLFCERKLI